LKFGSVTGIDPLDTNIKVAQGLLTKERMDYDERDQL